MAGVMCLFQPQHISLSHLRRSVRMASGTAPPHTATHLHSQQEAERLAAVFTTRGSSDQLPLHTHHLQQ
ncbi:hypothetical protein E2C01_022296 [Portunus trituberculatus]|uniref:Uncharacterized protein n=1 Tax=Portunus trituberculatus TaxID=210409 RepID=A0A5B7E6N8_PORTR|nr:hypothetical protein [Portunus trituberculatus]